MVQNRQLSIMLVAVVVIVAAFLVVALPLAHFNFKVMAADYGPSAETECGNEVTNLIRLGVSTPWYYDATLKNPSTQVLEVGRKFLICGDPITKTTKALRIWIGGRNTVYVPIRAGSIEPRDVK